LTGALKHLEQHATDLLLQSRPIVIRILFLPERQEVVALDVMQLRLRLVVHHRVVFLVVIEVIQREGMVCETQEELPVYICLQGFDAYSLNEMKYTNRH